MTRSSQHLLEPPEIAEYQVQELESRSRRIYHGIKTPKMPPEKTPWGPSLLVPPLYPTFQPELIYMGLHLGYICTFTCLVHQYHADGPRGKYKRQLWASVVP